MDRHENVWGLLIFTGLAAIIYILTKFQFTQKRGDLEPPVIPSKIPVIGHAIQLLRQASMYFVHIR